MSISILDEVGAGVVTGASGATSHLTGSALGVGLAFAAGAEPFATQPYTPDAFATTTHSPSGGQLPGLNPEQTGPSVQYTPLPATLTGNQLALHPDVRSIGCDSIDAPFLLLLLLPYALPLAVCRCTASARRAQSGGVSLTITVEESVEE